ncbi:MAG: LamG domain-containing protein [Ardenticatenaceae bacterium]|nr:LamG domain-containing protein [Ardenticatenaceae bacterium]
MHVTSLKASQPAGSTAKSIFYVNAARDDGLLAYWRFDENSGPTTADVSKTQAHGQLGGDAAFDSDLPPDLNLPNSSSLSLDGSGDFVDTADFDLPDDFTVTLWANSDTPFANQNMVGKHTAGGGNLLNFGLYDGKYHLRIRDVFVNFNQTALPDWQHVTVTGERSGTSTLVRFYLNGNETQAVTLNAVVGDLTGRPWTIGQDWDGGTRTDYFNGHLDDLRIYDRVLSPTEIGQLAAGEDHDGASWADAYSTLERALGAADAQDEIWVAGGVYTPTRPLDPADSRTATFQLKPQVDVFGGFAATETALDQRNPAANVTVLSGDIDGNDAADSMGVVTTTTSIIGRNSFHVVYATGIGPQGTTLDGFTITAGNARFDGGRFSDGRGGGIYLVEADPILSQLAFQGSAADVGGGLYLLASDPTLRQVVFSANTADDGGGLYVGESAPNLIGVIFSANRATVTGGGMLSNNADPTLNQVTFENNVANLGGGIFTVGDTLVLRQAMVVGNQASTNGGGIYLSTGNLQLVASTVLSNSAGSNGGGLYSEISSALIHDTLLQENSAFLGGAIANALGSLQIHDSTFDRNSAISRGGGLYSTDSSTLLGQVDFSHNTAGIHGAGIYDEDGTIEVSNGLFRSNAAGTSFGSGGGAYFLRTSPTVANAVFVANTAVGEGGGLSSNDSPLQMVNATFAANQAGGIGGGAFLTGVASEGALIGNTILWGNQDNSLGAELFINSGFGVTQTTNLISGTQGAPTSTPFERDPAPGPDQQWGTADDDHGDLRPFETSPAVDVGTNGLLLPDTLDLDGDGDMTELLPLDLGERPRLYGGAVDIGAHEWSPFFNHLPIINN